MSGYFSVKNFERFQHYKDRHPPWIKLYNGLLDDYEFAALPDASKAHQLAIGLLASRYSNRIPFDPAWVGKRINATEPVDLDVLVRAGFIILEQGCSNLLAKPAQVARPERETEERRDRGEKMARSANADAPPPKLSDPVLEEAVRLYTEAAVECGWPVPKKLSKPRQSRLRARLSDAGGLEGWRAAMGHARASPFLRGDNGRSGEHANWQPDLDFFLQDSKFTKLMEGAYNGREQPVQSANGSLSTHGAAILAEFRTRREGRGDHSDADEPGPAVPQIGLQPR